MQTRDWSCVEEVEIMQLATKKAASGGKMTWKELGRWTLRSVRQGDRQVRRRKIR